MMRIPVVRFTYLRLGLVFSFAALATFATVYIASGTPQQLAQARFDGWGYTLVLDPGGAPIAQVQYDQATMADLQRYAQTNRVLARQLVADGEKDMSVLVTFRRPLSVDEFRAWASRAPLRVKDYQFHAVGADGRPWTLGAAPSSGELVSGADLQSVLDHLKARGNALEVRGVVVVDGQVDAARYEQLADAPSVFLADVTRPAAAAHIKKTVRGFDHSRLAVVVPPAFARLEALSAAIPD